MRPVDRFVNYAKIDTQADETSGLTPSTEKQKDLGRLLVKELLELGLKDAHMDQYGNVYAHLKGVGEKIGFNAHIDTALEVTDTNVNPQIIEKYDGNDIVLGHNHVLSPKQFPRLLNYVGNTLVVTDGSTLLGGDDKAGIAIIMSALEYLVTHPEIKHSNISVAFTVDEEIGEGTKFFDYKKMDADYAYTLDGSDINNIDYENFNANKVTIKAHGVAIHPGEGKGQLVNAAVLINELVNSLPKNETPYHAGKDDGYWHINNINGDSEKMTLNMILRDFDEVTIQKYVSLLMDKKEELLSLYPKAKISVEVSYQYENMYKFVKDNIHVVKKADDALIKNGLNPVESKIRGGTDGATMSKNGLITPNLGTGSYNHHGRYEYLVVEEMQKMIDVVIDIVKVN